MIKQAIIPLAGLGTRLLPLTSVFPKELLPINGKPGLEYILDEGINAGIKEFIFIISNKKKGIKKYFCNDSFYKKIIKKNKVLADIIDYVDFMTTGNATDQGDLISVWRYSSGASNGPRAVNIGGDNGQGGSNYYNDTIQYWSMDSTGQAQDFGNLSQGRNGGAGMSGNG